MYSVPKFNTPAVPQVEVVGIRPMRSANEAYSQCQCTDCDSNDCGPNNPCGIEPVKNGAPPFLEFVKANTGK